MGKGRLQSGAGLQSRRAWLIRLIFALLSMSVNRSLHHPVCNPELNSSVRTR